MVYNNRTNVMFSYDLIGCKSGSPVYSTSNRLSPFTSCTQHQRWFYARSQLHRRETWKYDDKHIKLNFCKNYIELMFQWCFSCM